MDLNSGGDGSPMIGQSDQDKGSEAQEGLTLTAQDDKKIGSLEVGDPVSVMVSGKVMAVNDDGSVSISMETKMISKMNQAKAAGRAMQKEGNRGASVSSMDNSPNSEGGGY